MPASPSASVPPATIVALALALALAMAACAGGSGTPVPTAGGSGPPDSAAGCPELALLSLDGEEVDLTGRWRTGHDGATYYLRQVNSCLWITGFSADAGTPADGSRPTYTNAFFGHLQTDFTFEGWWAEMPWGQSSEAGTVVWEVQFADVEGQTSVTLRVVDEDDFPLLLVRPESTADLHLRFPTDAACLSAISDDGQRYELVVEAHEWTITHPFGLAGPGSVLLGAGDTFQARGELARGSGDCGAGWLLIADEIEPTGP